MTAPRDGRATGKGDRYRWVVLVVGAAGAGTFSALRSGLPAIEPALRDAYDLSLPQVGLTLTALSVGVTVMLVPWGILTDRIGERPVMTTGLAGTALAVAGAAFAPSFGWLLIGMLIAGMFGASATGASGRAIMAWFGRAERGFALGIRQMAIPLGGALASVTLPALVNEDGLERPLLALSGLLLSAALAAVIWLRDAPPELSAAVDATRAEQSPMRDRRVWRLGAASALLVIAQAALVGFVVLFLVDVHHASGALAAAALALTQLGAAVTRVVAGRRSDRAGVRIPLLKTIARRNAVLLVALAVLTQIDSILAVPLALVATTSTMSWNGLSFTAAAEISGRARAGTSMSLQNMIIGCGSALAPVWFGLVVSATSWSAGFALVACAPAVAFFVLGPLQEEEAERVLRRTRRLAAQEALRPAPAGAGAGAGDERVAP